MKLSIALAAYNGAPYITEQLLSILNQERPADEVILVDDGSTDGTDRIINAFLERYQPKNWYFFRNEKNLGYVRNFRRALSRTTGDLILLCDQDDIWYPHKTKLIEELFLSHPEIRVLDTSFQLMNEEGNNYEVPQKRGWINNNLLRAVPNREGLARIPLGYVLQRNISCGCTMAFTSSVRNVYLKHSHGRIQHDWEINILGALQDGLYYLDRRLIRHRIHGNNTSAMAKAKNPSLLSYARTILDGWEEASRDFCLRVRQFTAPGYFTRHPENRAVWMRTRCLSELRRAAVEKHSIRAWAREVWLYRKLASYTDARGLLLDLLFALRLDRIMKLWKNS